MTALKYLVTGASGFIGWHLVSALREKKSDLKTWVRSGKDHWSGQVKVADVDIQDAKNVDDAFAAADPDVIFHLAAQSLPMRSWANPIETVRVNVEGTINLLEAVRKAGGRNRRILLAGSSGQYAPSQDGSAIAEDGPAGPGSPYAASKIASDWFGDLYGKGFDLDVVRFRPFAWIGTHKQGDVASDLARRVVAIERGEQAVLTVGRTDVVRDIIDVRDGVAALLLLNERAKKGGVYNICRGKGTSVAELIEEFRRQSRVPFDVSHDVSLVRPVDELVKIGRPDRIFELGWRPRYSLAQSVAEILGYWRNRTEV
jgi:GDP-4-dehydro-6-deoxy-D-mannose reductase